VNFSAFTRSILLGSALVAVSYAASAQVRQPTVFMLQFGSYETKDEAEDKLKSIGTKHGGMLTKYPPLIREIVMPPDNLTVYRTQAGPVGTREDAQGVCSQLASQGDECYVVETAMVGTGTPAPAMQQAGIVPLVDDSKIIPTDSRPIPSRDPDNLKAIEKVAKPMSPEAKVAMNQEMDRAAQINEPALAAPAPRIHSNAQLAGATQTPEAATAEKEGSFWSWLGGDDEDDAEAVAAYEAKVRAEREAEATRMRAAPVDSVATLDTTPPAPPAPAVALSALPTGAGLKPMAQMQPLPQLNGSAPTATEVALNAAPLAPAPESFAPPAPVLAPEGANPVIPATPEAPVDAYLGNSGIKLPPPPPPTNMADRETLARPVVAPLAPIETQPVAPVQGVPAPVLAVPVAPESTGSITSNTLPPAPFKKGTSVPPGGGENFSRPDDGGEVQVGEAQRVPLTQAQQLAPMESVSPIEPAAKVIGVNEAPEVADNTPPPPPATAVEPPSSMANQKTLWAHIHYFPDQQAALSFWDGYRNAHPDFPVVRVRTTSSLIAQQQGDMRVALRIGPFAQQGFINILCNSVRTSNPQLQCGAITDMGASSNAYAPRDRFAQTAAQAARYANNTAKTASGFWVQLGTFPTTGAAELAWEDAKTQHGDALSDMDASITSPEQGSQAQQVFRLRTGPFNTQMAAKDVCSRVKVNSGTCLVVSD